MTKHQIVDRILKPLLLVLGCAALAIAFLMGVELVSVYFDDTGYHWGTEGPNPWHYENKAVYLVSTAGKAAELMPAAVLGFWCRKVVGPWANGAAMLIVLTVLASIWLPFDRALIEAIVAVGASAQT